MDERSASSRGVGFSFWFPVANLLVWLIFVAGPIVRTYYSLSSAPRSAGRTTFGNWEFPTDRIPDMSVHFGLGSRADAVRGLEVPATVVELIISRIVSWPSAWHPARILIEDWRALIYPFFCLPFCWFAGYGADKLLRRDKVGSKALSAGTLLMILIVIVLLGLRFGMEPSERSDGFGWILSGLALWAFLFTAFPLAFLRSRLSREAITA